MTLFAFKVGLVTFWVLWLFMVFLTNVCEELKLLRVVAPYWKFASQNFQAIAQATGRYQAPPWVPHLLFVGVLVWQMGNTAVLWTSHCRFLVDGNLGHGSPEHRVCEQSGAFGRVHDCG